jgi:hypothetical protein
VMGTVVPGMMGCVVGMVVGPIGVGMKSEGIAGGILIPPFLPFFALAIGLDTGIGTPALPLLVCLAGLATGIDGCAAGGAVAPPAAFCCRFCCCWCCRSFCCGASAGSGPSGSGSAASAQQPAWPLQLLLQPLPLLHELLV